MSLMRQQFLRTGSPIRVHPRGVTQTPVAPSQWSAVPSIARCSCGGCCPQCRSSLSRRAETASVEPTFGPLTETTSPPSCTTASRPDADMWLSDPVLSRIRQEPPGLNQTLLSQPRKSKGQSIRLVQQAVHAWGCDVHRADLLPRFGIDGAFGRETRAAVEIFQQDVGINLDGVVGPVTLAKLDDFVLSGIVPPGLPDIVRQTPTPQPPVPVTGAKAAAPVSTDAAVASRIKSTTMTGRRPTVQRQDAGHKVNITLDTALALTGTVVFTSGAALGTLQFGFFQLGRPFETLRFTYTRKDGKAVSDPNLLRNATFAIRKSLPAQDHSGLFFEDPTNPATAARTATIGAGSQSVTARYTDRPGTAVEKETNHNGIDYQLDGISLESFFFTAFGLVKGGQVLVLNTAYWDMKYCERIPLGANLSATQPGQSITLSAADDCRTSGCSLGEPGASGAAGSAPGWGNTVSPSDTYLSIVSTAFGSTFSTGPGKFSIDCSGKPG
jgi:Putative peptidoglycan binding domain